ncbi:hypothetical protein [Aestuariivirga sp.]|uniref:hypothetical protein n=1 Tax=Aestuariivirga sp. TaxID=2650926 RepID=UPI0039E6D82C
MLRRLTSRAALIAIAFLAANVPACLYLTLHLIMAMSQQGYALPGEPGWIVLIARAIAMTFPDWLFWMWPLKLVFVTAAEFFAVRARWFYACWGVIAAICSLPIVLPGAPFWIVSLLVIGVGLLTGYIYWAIAGRRAGAGFAQSAFELNRPG